jgi:mRNA interferase HigB
MQIVSVRTLRDFWERHPRSEKDLRAWCAIVRAADWATSEDVKADWGKRLDFVGDNRVIFDIRGNEFRLIVHVAYAYKRVLIKFIGTHAEYDKIEPSLHGL